MSSVVSSVLRHRSLVVFIVIISLVVFAASCGKGKGAGVPTPAENQSTTRVGEIDMSASQGVRDYSAGMSLDTSDDLLPGVQPESVDVEIIGFQLVPLNEGGRYDRRLKKYYRIDISEERDEKLVVVRVEDVLDMKFALFEVRYDTLKYTPAGAEFGGFLGGTSETVSLYTEGEFGTVALASFRVKYDLHRGADGSGVIATLRFKNEPFSGERRTSKVPLDAENKVVLTSGIAFGSTGRFREINIGDYTLDGEVTIADVAPVAVYYLESAMSSIGANNADGNGDGDVTIADVAPIANHYLNQIAGYNVYRLESGTPPTGDDFTGEPWQVLDRQVGLTGEDPKPVYSFTDPLTAPDVYYVVAPVDGEGNSGIKSSVLQGEILGDPPEVTITNPADGSDVSGVVTIEADVTGSALISLVEFFAEDMVNPIGSDDAFPYSFEWDTSILSDESTRSIKVVATDEFTRTGMAEITVNNVFFMLGIDPPDGGNFSGGIVQIEATTDYTGVLDVTFFIDDVEVGTDSTAPYTYDWDVDAATDGPHNVRIDAEDEAAHLKQVGATYTKGAASNLFDQALEGIGFAAADLNLGGFPAQVGFGGFTNYGNDATSFDGDGVPGSRFGSFTNYWHDDHTALPQWSADFTDSLAGSSNYEEIITQANNIFFEGASRQTLWGNPNPGSDYTPAGTDPLATAVINLITNHGGTPDEPGITNDASDVPEDLQNALAIVLQAADGAATARNDWMSFFFGAYDPGEPPESNIWHIVYEQSHALFSPITLEYLWALLLFGLNEDGGGGYIATDQPYAAVYGYLAFAQAAVDLAHALDQVDAVLAGGFTGTFDFDQDTPIGRILVNSGDGATVYPDDDYLLICDVDGGDTYNGAAGANNGILNPVSISLDLDGDDQYAAMDDYSDGLADDTHSQFGTGRHGVGILVDYAGNDEYNSSLNSQGSGIFGWGLLVDKEGDDTYLGVGNVQGSALGGIGILWDQGGSDSYSSWNQSQGYGGIWGVGILVDGGIGNDTYYAEPDATVGPSFASLQNTAVNSSFSQGAAFGLRTTYTGDPPVILLPAVWDGGVGALIDGGGDDHYTSGVFGQGIGFWFATGILDDRGGNDEYDGVYYVQSATAHYGASILMDRAGDDDFNSDYETRGFPLDNVTQGGAHDHSVSWLLDGEGTDTFYAPNLSLGTGNVNGWGYFIDMGLGVDSYLGPGANTLTLGRGHLSGEVPDGDTREGEITFGLFIDCGGNDTYDDDYADIPSGSIGNVSAGNNKSWFRFGYDNDPGSDFRSNEFGTGVDGNGFTGFEFD